MRLRREGIADVERPRLLAAIAASAVAGALIYWFVITLGLPGLAERLAPPQIEWLRETARSHPGRLIAGVALASGLLALPVLLVFRVVYGPFTGAARGRRDT
jgi:hypothetical protein